MTRTLYRGGRVLGSPDAAALLVTDDVITWIGTELDVDADQVVELDGALVTPAFVDAHIHATAAGLTLNGLDLTGTRSRTEALDALAAYIRAADPAVVLGHGWDESSWSDGLPLTRAELDHVAGGRAVYLTRIDVHSAAVSSALVAAAPDAIGCDGYDASGPLSREAHHAVRAAALAAVTPAQRDGAQRATLDRCAALGIAAVHECAGPAISGTEDLTALLALAAASAGPLVTAYWGELASDGGVDRALALGALGAAGDLFVDGALGSHTACVAAPYADADTQGASYVDLDAITDHVVGCARAGLQAGFHAIGDAALQAVVSGFEAAATVVGADVIRQGRHRIEHAEMLDDHLVARLAALAITASVQPVFDALWGGSPGMYATRLGVDRARTLNPFAAMSRAGVPLAFGSDAPVTPLGGWEAVRAAAYHRTPEHAVPVEEAFTAHTVGGWRAAKVDDAGLIAVGAPAHLAVWATESLDDGLPDLAPGGTIPTCLRTVVAGRTIFTLQGALA